MPTKTTRITRTTAGQITHGVFAAWQQGDFHQLNRAAEDSPLANQPFRCRPGTGRWRQPVRPIVVTGFRVAGGADRGSGAPGRVGRHGEPLGPAWARAGDEKHFRPSDAPLLVRYVQNVALAGRAAAALDREGAVIAGRPNPWLTVAEKCDRALVALSMRLRISPQARLRADGMAAKGPQASIYDLMGQDDE